jgi:hypothetical protein
MATERYPSSSTAALTRGHQGAPFALTDYLSAPLPIAEEAGKRFGWNLCVIDDAADDPALEHPEAFMTGLHTAIGSSKTRYGAPSESAP